MGGKITEKKQKNIRLYILGASVLTAMILAAFFAPQLVFGVQDRLRCLDYEFHVQEAQDITLLSTSYETSLYNRLLQFAEDKQSGTQIYVTSSELTPNQELQEFLQSSIGLNQEGILLLADIGLLSYEFLEQRNVTEWKQYVIYNENYDRGVNFIIWYIKMEDPKGVVFRFLLDAQTGSVYGVQSEHSAWLAQEENKKLENNIKLHELMGISMDSETDIMDAWMGLAYYYGGFQERKEFLAEIEETYEILDIDGYVKEPYTDKREVLWSKEYVSKRVTDNEVWYSFTFPYEEYSQNFRVQQDSNMFFVENYYTPIVDITVGFPDIYELIPEFGE